MSGIMKKNTVNFPAEWKINREGLEAIEKASESVHKTGGHGIISGIPIICRGDKCPYIDSCPMETLGTKISDIVGQRCPVEISKIMKLFTEYVEQFNIDVDLPENRVVLGLIKELVDYEIQIERADKIMAKDGHFLEDVVVGIDSNGRPIKNKEISKPVDYKERALKKKHEILQLLNSTPKDKAGQKVNIVMDPSTYAAQLVAKAKELQENGVIISQYTVEEDDKQ
jgi:hypothetical protein